MHPALITTTTLARIGVNKSETVRAECILKTAAEAKRHGYPLVAIDGGSPPDYINALRRNGARVFEQEEPGMGNARRQALRQARELVPEGHAIVWMEPEKYTLISELADPVATLAKGEYDLVMLRRRSLESYPPEQAMSYQMIALATKYLTGIDSDFGWGPTLMSADMVEYYLSYQSQHGDLWDGIHCPKLQIIRDGRPWTIVDVDYTHPPEQTRAETGIHLLPKRIRQMDQLVAAITTEVDRLGMRVE